MMFPDTGTLIAEVRYLCDLKVRDVPLRELETRLAAAAAALGAKLQWVIKEETQALRLAADQVEYVLPADVDLILAASWGTTTLTPFSARAEDRDLSSWRLTASVSNPSQYAVEGRTLLLNPPPSADAIETDPFLRFRYVGCPSGYDLADGRYLGESERWLLVYRTCIDYLTRENKPEKAGMLALARQNYEDMLPDAMGRTVNRVPGFQPPVSIFRRRAGAAR